MWKRAMFRSLPLRHPFVEVSFPAADKSFNIYGDLYLPEVAKHDDDNTNSFDKIPAIVIVAGSGPIDRQGNASGLLSTLGFNTNNRFAEYMMESSSSTDENKRHNPVAILTYDKRGVGKSLKAGDNDWYYRAGMMDLVSDAVEAVRFLQSHPRIDPKSIVVMGHSEGSIILPLISQQIRQHPEGLAELKGGIFLSGFGENLFDAMKFQQANIIHEVENAQGAKGWILRKLITKERVEKQQKDLMETIDSREESDFIRMYCGIAKIPAKWFREHKQYDVHSTLASEMTCHCLAITGCKDVQVRHAFCQEATAKSLVPKAASIESHTLGNLTHALRSFEGSPSMLSLKQDYAHQGTLPLDAELLSLIATWCDRILHGNQYIGCM